LAGTVSNLVEKEYLPRKNKEKNIDQKRKYYTFTLTDFTSSIDAIHFCNISSEKHFSKLISDGKFVICIGNTKKNIGKSSMQYMIKSMSLCNDDENSHNIEEKEEETESEYKFAKPEAYIRTIQGSLFDEKTEYPEWIKNNRWVVFDCETTGLEPDKNDITEIGAVKIVNGQIVEKFQHLCKPFEPISNRITKITGITNDMVKDEPTSFDILNDFITFAKDSILVGYNVDFDYQFILNVAKRKEMVINYETHDCLADAKSKIPYLPNYKLITIVNHLGITLDNAHRALYDATATAEAFLALSLI
ncbi:MAG: 3'-5' exonuclease, partial [Clostridia bacterium]|nr:3'-5' exonuclease [Clostridia bacterium]